MVSGNIDEQFLSDLGFNPLNITQSYMDNVEIRDEEAMALCLSFQHVTVYVPMGDVRRQICLAKFCLEMYGLKEISVNSSMDPQSRLN